MDVSWTIEKAEHRRIDAFELWCWRRLLRVPWTAGRSNQSMLKEISPEYSLEGLILKLKLQCFVHLMCRTDSLEKTMMLGKIEGRRRRGQQDEMVGWRHRLDRHEFEWTPGVGDGQGGLVCCHPWGHKESDTTERLNWTELKVMYTLLHSKWISNKHLLYSTWNSCSVLYATWTEEGVRGELVHEYVWLSLSAVHLKLPQHCSSAGCVC